MEIVFAAIIWAQTIHYVPMSLGACEAAWQQSIVGWHPRLKNAPVIECMKAKWTCERGFQLVPQHVPEGRSTLQESQASHATK